MRRRRGPLTVLALLFLSLLAAGFAATAAAGGPTSVLLVAQAENRTASLYTGNRDYDELARLVGAFGSVGGSTTAPENAGPGGPSGTIHDSDPGITLTWLIHDVTVWRVDRVFLTAKNGPWISTQTNIGSTQTNADGTTREVPVTWHNAAANGKALTALLNRLGLGAGGTAGGSDPATQGADVLTATAAPAPVTSTPNQAELPKQEDATGLPGPDGVIWGSVGLLVGVTLTLASRRWTAGAQASANAAATENDDATDGAVPTDDAIAVTYPVVRDSTDAEVGRPKTETLSSHSTLR